MSKEFLRDAGASVFIGYVAWAGALFFVDHENEQDKNAVTDQISACADALDSKAQTVNEVPGACEPYASEFIRTETSAYRLTAWVEFNHNHQDDIDQYQAITNRHGLFLLPIGGLATWATYRVLSSRKPEEESDAIVDIEEDTESNIEFQRIIAADADTTSKPQRKRITASKKKGVPTEEKLDFSQILDSMQNGHELRRIAVNLQHFQGIVKNSIED